MSRDPLGILDFILILALSPCLPTRSGRYNQIEDNNNKKDKYEFLPFPPVFFAFFPFFLSFSSSTSIAASMVALSRSVVSVLLHLLAGSSALDCSLLWLVDLDLGAAVTTPALWLRARWSLEILDKGTGGGEGGEGDMVVVEGQDALTWHVGFKVLVAKNIYQLKIEPRQSLDSVSVK